MILLVGLMGSGKSTVGRLVAERTGRTLVDVDDEIRRRTGLTTRQLWERAGEAGYRPLERDVSVHVLAEGGPVVLALPGGAIDDELVRAAIAGAEPFTAWLRARPATLAACVADSDHRPLLADRPEVLLEHQQAERGPRFEAIAQLVVDVDDLTAAEAAERIVAAVEARGGRPPAG